MPKNRNLYLMYAIALLQGMVFYAPVASLYRQAAGLNLAQIALIEGISYLLALAAELLRADYGWAGVVLIALFEISRYTANQNLVRFCGMLVLFHYMPSMVLQLGNFSVPMQALGALAMLFIAAYDGRKATKSKAIQWGFYLFYPVHLLILYILSLIPNVFPIGISILA